MTDRTASITRQTNETDITLDLDLDSSREISVTTGVPFFDHMLHALARHGRFGGRPGERGPGARGD